MSWFGYDTHKDKTYYTDIAAPFHHGTGERDYSGIIFPTTILIPCNKNRWNRPAYIRLGSDYPSGFV